MIVLQLFTRNWDEMLSAYLLSNIIYRRPKAHKLKLEISGPGLRFIVIYMRTVQVNVGSIREFLVSVQQPRRSQAGVM